MVNLPLVKYHKDTKNIMTKSIKPILGVSKCLEFDNCRYDGKIIGNDFVRKLKNHVEFIPVCPEVGIGLGSPRQPIRLVRIKGKKNLYQPSTDENLTQKMEDFSNKFFGEIQEIDGFILKHSSPTCGVRNVRLYHKVGKQVGFDQTIGMFTELLSKRFPNLVIEDEARLRNSVLKDSFLTRVFTMARLRDSLSSKDKTIQFCKDNEMLFMCYDKNSSKKLMDLLSSKIPELERKEKIIQMVFNLLNRIPNSDSLFGTYQYILSMFNERLAIPEKDYFKETMSGFSKGNVLPSEISTLLYSCALRFDMKSILSQTIFEPYPKELIQNNSERREYSLLKI